jgi:predicted nucleic acid-binding protein
VAERWALNASPLIVLCQARLEYLFLQLPAECIIPQAVADEIKAGPEGDRARRFLESRQLPVIGPTAAPHSILAWDLGAGETAVLACALADPSLTAILDDAAARRCARSFSISVKGTLGIVLLARQRGLVDSASEVLHSLRASGFRLDDRTVAEALRRTVGESWL